jgi:hypothetical protein
LKFTAATMKVVFIIGVFLTVFLAVQIFGFFSQRGIQKYPYKTVEVYDDFEVREYEPSLFTSVKLTASDYKTASSQGFSMLAGYIFGGNESEEKIAMTSPVSMSIGDSVTIMFMVPKEMKKEDLPKPNQPNIVFKEEPAKTMAAISFGGWANDSKIMFFKDKLTITLERQGITHQNRFYFFGYNAPYEVFNRLNEVLVEIETPHDNY